MNNIHSFRDFLPPKRNMAAPIMSAAITGSIVAAILTCNQSSDSDKWMKIAGGAVIGAIAGVLLPCKRDSDQRKW